MPVRSLDFLDLPFLRRYQRHVLPLDSAWTLTRGNPLGVMALLAYLNPRRNLYTAFYTQNTESILGQITKSKDQPFARLSFLAPANHSDALEVPLLEHLAVRAGKWGAEHLLAEVDEDNLVFKSLRRAGFSVYAWQRVWRLTNRKAKNPNRAWRSARSSDVLAIQLLHSQIVPPLIQPIEPLPWQPTGMVCSTKEQFIAYAALTYGPAGIWVQPLIHPDSNCAAENLLALLTEIPGHSHRPIYFCLRSYQAWLESMLEDLGADAGPRQAVMVKHLAVAVQARSAATQPEKAWPKTAAPIARSDSKNP